MRNEQLYFVLDENHQVIPAADLHAWADFQDKHKRVALTERGGVRVSTVFLGIDHSFGNGPPMMFETMIFGGPFDDYQDRYSSYDDALLGHRRACRIAFPPAPVTPSRNKREGRYLARLARHSSRKGLTV